MTNILSIRQLNAKGQYQYQTVGVGKERHHSTDRRKFTHIWFCEHGPNLVSWGHATSYNKAAENGARWMILNDQKEITIERVYEVAL